MPGGYKKLNGSDGNTFSSTNQPKRYRGPSLVTRLKKILEDDPKRLEAILESIVSKAEKGDLKAVEMVFDRIDGKPQQTLKVEENKQVTSITIKTVE